MKKVLIISLLAVHLLGNTDIIQLLRLPMLMVQYQNHLRDDDSLGLIDFVCSNYGKGDGILFDDVEEKGMPFMRVNRTIFSTVILPFSKTPPLPPVTRFKSISHFEFTQLHIPEYYTLSLLRPPIIFG